MDNKLSSKRFKNITTGEMIKLSLCTALLCISSYIVFPLPFTPVMITGQTIVVNIIALILNPINSSMSILMFILLGAVGLPVFAGGSGGVGALFGPTGGFIFGFIFSAIAISNCKGKKPSFSRYILITTLVGMPITYLFGLIYMSYILNITYLKALQIAVLPFIVGDIFKAIIGSMIGLKINTIRK